MEIPFHIWGTVINDGKLWKLGKSHHTSSQLVKQHCTELSQKTMETLENYEKHDIKEHDYWMLLGGSFQKFLL